MSSTALIQDAAAAARQRGVQPGRLDVLDGVRGWSALIVVAYHMFWETFGVLVPGFRNPLTGFLLDGRLAVCVFFVLSGEALSAAFFAGKGDPATIRLAIKRYPRLAIPILYSCLVIFVLDQCGLIYNRDAAEIVQRADWLGVWLQNPPNLTTTLRFALFGVFVSDEFTHAPNPMLWTMRIELLGSFALFAMLIAWSRIPQPRICAAILFLHAAFAPSNLENYLSCFFAGAIFADWRARGFFTAAGTTRRWAPTAAIAAIGLADGFLHYFGYDVCKPLFAVVLVLAIYSSPPFTAFFSKAVSRALGRISFPLYLIQFPVLLSLTSGLIVRAGHNGPLSLVTIWGIALASTAACLLAAIAFEPIEALSRNAGDRLVTAVIWSSRRLAPPSVSARLQSNRKAEIVLPPIASRKLDAPAAPSAAPTTTISGSRCSSRG